MTEPSYITFIGDVGTGKSTLVEMMTGVTGHSSAANQSATRETMMFWTQDGSIIVADTPGANAMNNKLQHNIQIAFALNFRPISKIFIVVKADTRIDTTVDFVRKYSEQLLELNSDYLGVIVTHMDTVSWTDADFLPSIGNELGITNVIYSSKNQNAQKLINDILAECRKHVPIKLSIDGDEFFRLFKFHKYNLKILKSTKNQVEHFKKLKRDFDEQRKNFPEQEKADLIFEFQAWMTEYITTAQRTVTAENNFTFQGEAAADQASHIATMTNQLRAVLFDIRIETLNKGATGHGVNELKRCPHCGLVWAKIVGCNGETTCGAKVPEDDAIEARNNGVMATFTFRISQDTLQITKSGQRNVKTSTSSSNVGCGGTIIWENMASVPIPTEFKQNSQQEVSTRDIDVLPQEASPVKDQVNNLLSSVSAKFGNEQPK